MEASFIYFFHSPLPVSWFESFYFILFSGSAGAFCVRSECTNFKHSDRPRVYENHWDSPPGPYSLEKDR